MFTMPPCSPWYFPSTCTLYMELTLEEDFYMIDRTVGTCIIKHAAVDQHLNFVMYTNNYADDLGGVDDADERYANGGDDERGGGAEDDVAPEGEVVCVARHPARLLAHDEVRRRPQQ